MHFSFKAFAAAWLISLFLYPRLKIIIWKHLKSIVLVEAKWSILLVSAYGVGIMAGGEGVRFVLLRYIIESS